MVLALIALQPSEGPKAIEYYVEVFVVLWAIVSWIYIAVIAVRTDNPSASSWCTFLAILNIVFFAGCALAITIAIAPAKKCDDTGYIDNNRLIAGVQKRCSLVQIDVGLLWGGIIPLHWVTNGSPDYLYNLRDVEVHM